jgi:hypothetical protein
VRLRWGGRKLLESVLIAAGSVGPYVGFEAKDATVGDEATLGVRGRDGNGSMTS